MNFGKIDKDVFTLNDSEAGILLILNNSLLTKKQISRGYLAECLKVESEDYITRILKKLEDQKLIKRDNKYVNGRSYLNYNVPVRDENWFGYTYAFMGLRIPLRLKGFALILRCLAWDDSLRLKFNNVRLAKMMNISRTTLIKNIKELEKVNVIVDRQFNKEFFLEGKNYLNSENAQTMKEIIDETYDADAYKNDGKVVVKFYNGYPSTIVDGVYSFFNKQLYLKPNANKIFEKIIDPIPDFCYEEDPELLREMGKAFSIYATAA